MNKHRYPAKRKNRNVSYSKSYKLLQTVGEERLRQLFSKDGMYTISKILSKEYGEYISPYVVRHCRSRYKLGGLIFREIFSKAQDRINSPKD